MSWIIGFVCMLILLFGLGAVYYRLFPILVQKMPKILIVILASIVSVIIGQILKDLAESMFSVHLKQSWFWGGATFSVLFGFDFSRRRQGT